MPKQRTVLASFRRRKERITKLGGVARQAEIASEVGRDVSEDVRTQDFSIHVHTVEPDRMSAHPPVTIP